MEHRLCALVLGGFLCGVPGSASYGETAEDPLEALAKTLVERLVAKERTRVSVLDFTDIQGRPNVLGRYLAECLDVQLANMNGVTVVDRRNIARIMKEHKLAEEGLIDPANARQLGQFAGVEAILIGSLAIGEENVELLTKAVCTETSEILSGGQTSLPLTLLEDSGTRVTGSMSLDDRAELFRYGLEAAGFTVHEGELAIFEVDDCDLVPHCWANNPTSPYGVFRVPAAQDEPDPDPEGRYQIGDGHRAFYRLRPDEAIVFIGTTPPTSPYFSFTGYVFSRWNPGSTGAPPYDDRVEVFGSLGDSLNQLVLQTSAGPGEGPWNKETVVVFTADRNTELSIRQALTDAGFPGSVVNTLVIPRFEANGVTPLARMGYANEDDVFTVLARIAHPDATVQGTPIRQWLDAPGVRLVRVRPVAQTPLDPLPFPPLRPTGTGQSESGQSLAALVLSITELYTRRGTLVTSFTPAAWEDGYSCINNMYPCLADCRDTPYLVAVTRLRPWESVIVAGYNHERSGKASYVNITATRLSDQRAFYSVVMGDLVGSADVYLPSHPDRQNLWQAVFRRSCLGQPYCFEVTPEQIPFDEAFSLLVRAYLEPPTRTSPKALPRILSEIVFPRLIRVSGIPGDYDMDGDVDLDDFEIFKSCVSGPAVPRAQTPVCLAADFDTDGDVDLDDFGLFQRCYSGEGVPADPDCAG